MKERKITGEVEQYSREDLIDFIEGAAFLATGGGGSKVIAKSLLAQSAIDTVLGINVSDLAEDLPIAMVAQVFAPSAIWDNQDYYSALYSFCSLCPPGGGVLVGEIGAVNGIVPAIVAAKTRSYLVKGSEADRSTSEMDMGLFQAHVPLQELHLVSKDRSVSQKFTYGDDTDAMHAEQDILHVLETNPEAFQGVAGFATYPMTGRALQQYADAGYLFTDAFDYALEIGRAMRSADAAHNILTVIQRHLGGAYTPYRLFTGYFVRAVLQSCAQDYGYVDFRSSNPDSLAGVRIYYSNENMIAYTTIWNDSTYKDCTEISPAAIGPDAMSYVLLENKEFNADYQAGYSLSNDAFRKELHGYPEFFKENQLAIIGIPEPRLRTADIIASFAREITRTRAAFGKDYAGPYIPIENLQPVLR